jgi:hypothetical protein
VGCVARTLTALAVVLTAASGLAQAAPVIERRPCHRPPPVSA